jgi:hypothetical protein
MEDLMLLGVIVATLAAIGLGFLWYSPAVFGSVWLRLLRKYVKDVPSMNKSMGPMYLQLVLGAFVQAFVLDMFINRLGVVTAVEAVVLALWLWVGLVLPGRYNDVIFEGKRKKMFLIDVGYQAVSLVVMAVVLVLL